MKALAFAIALAASAAIPTVAAADIFVFRADLTGPAEAPPNASPGTGLALVTYDDVLHTLFIEANWQDLIAGTTVAHIHAPTAVPGAGAIGVAVTPGTFPGFPVGLTSGSYTSPAPLDLTAASTYTAGFVNNFAGGNLANAEGVLIDALNSNRAYFNVHTSAFPGGEIRGFLTAVPEPGTWALMIAGFGVTGAMLRRRRRRAFA